MHTENENDMQAAVCGPCQRALTVHDGREVAGELSEGVREVWDEPPSSQQHVHRLQHVCRVLPAEGGGRGWVEGGGELEEHRSCVCVCVGSTVEQWRVCM